MFNFFHSLAIGIVSAITAFTGAFSPIPQSLVSDAVPATSTSPAVITTTTEKAAPAKQKVPVAPADSPLLIVEKCEAQREISRGTMWPVMLEVVTLAEQKRKEATIEALMEASTPGTTIASDIAPLARISYAEHEKNIQTAESKMEAQLAKEYSACLNGI